VTRFRTRKAASLLAWLALEEKPVAREVLAEGLWPESEAENGRNSFRVALASLRRQLEPSGTPLGSVLQADRSTVALDPLLVASDVREFQLHARAARETPDVEQRLAHLKRACEIYSPPLLPGFYEEWISAHEQQLEAIFESASAELIVLLKQRGDTDQARRWAERRRQIAAHALAQPRSQAQPPCPEPCSKGVAQAHAREVDGAAQTSRFSPAEVRAEAPLPPLWNRFFGRQEEMRVLLEALGAGERIVTLHGIGGCGKTRLALEAAHLLRQGTARSGASRAASTWEQNGAANLGRSATSVATGASFDKVLWVPLADVGRGEVVADSIATALQLKSQGERPPLEAIALALAEQRVLLILDNFEQLALEGTPTLRALLERLPLLQMLVTSRLRLHEPGERELPLRPLPIPLVPVVESNARPSAGSDTWVRVALDFASVAMFVDRAQRARADFDLTPHNARDVLEVVRALEGLPLAIELAGARAGSLSARAMREQLREPLEFLRSRRPFEPRRDALRSCIAWSLQMLPEELQKFWARLWVFRGGCTLQDATQICGQNNSSATLEALEELRDASLLVFNEGRERYFMPEVLRAFALEQLQENEKQELLEAHGKYFVALCEAWNTTFHDTGETDLSIEDDFFNIQALFERALDEPKLEKAWRALSALSWFWTISGHLYFAFETAQRLLELARARNWQAPSWLKAQMEMTAGLMALHAASSSLARACFGRALSIMEALDDTAGVATAHNYLGAVALARAEVEVARRHFALSLEMNRKRGQPRHIAIALSCLAAAEVEAGELEQAHILCEEARSLWRTLEDGGGQAWVLSIEGDAASAQKNWTLARRCQERALELRRERNAGVGETGPLAFLGYIALDEQDDLDSATEYVQHTPAEREDRYALAASLLCLGARGRLHLGHRREVLPILEALAGLTANAAASTCGAHEEEKVTQAQIAARALGAAESWRQEMEVFRLASAQRRWSRSCERLRRVLGAKGFEAEHLIGRSLPLEDAARALLTVFAAA